MMANASLRSYINHRDQSGLSRPFLRGTGIITTQYIHKCVKVNKAINKFKAIMNLKQRGFYGSNTLWNYAMANASWRSYIIHRDQSGLSRPFLRGTRKITTQCIHKCVKVNKAINVFKALRKAINKFKAIMNLKQRGFYGSNTLWNYAMANASLRSYIIHRDQSGSSRPFLRGTGIITTQYIHKYVVKVNKTINILRSTSKSNK